MPRLLSYANEKTPPAQACSLMRTVLPFVQSNKFSLILTLSFPCCQLSSSIIDSAYKLLKEDWPEFIIQNQYLKIF